MLDYLKNILGVDIAIAAWNMAESLPAYLRNGREYDILTIEGQDYLLIKTSDNRFQLSGFLKQRGKLPDFLPEQMILCFPRLDSHQRKALIENHVQFIVPGNQIYLPFLGVLLQERSVYKAAPPQKLSAIGQYVLLFFLYGNASEVPVTKSAIAKELSITAMTATRAVRELEALQLVSVRRQGRSDYINLQYTGRELFQKAKKYLMNPVQKTVFVKQSPLLDDLPLSGESALAHYSMLNPPKTICRAIERRTYKSLPGIETVDPAWELREDYVVLELWKYEPGTFSESGCVDRVSLSCVLKNCEDERIEASIEEMMEA